MKKIYLCLILLINLNAIDINDIGKKAFDSAFNALDKKFNNLLKQGTNFADQCYDLNSISFGQNIDICSIANEIDNLNVNVCSLIGGSGVKKIGITGAKALCNSKTKEFSDYTSKQATDFVEWSLIDKDDSGSSFSKLPNGQNMNQYFQNWNVSNILKKDKGIAGSYLKDGNMKAVSAIMDYSKTNGAKTNLEDIKIEDIKAPKDLESYHKGVVDSVKNYKNALKESSPNQVSNSIKIKLSQNNDPNEVKNYVAKAKKNFDIAKQMEISNALAVSNHKVIAIPTDEYVQTMRKDLRPEIVAQIRKQQAIETAIISSIEEKYAKKYEIAKLLADKEIIMAMQFDEKSAREEIDKITGSDSSSGGINFGSFLGGGIGGGFGNLGGVLGGLGNLGGFIGGIGGFFN